MDIEDKSLALAACNNLPKFFVVFKEAGCMRTARSSKKRAYLKLQDMKFLISNIF